MCQLRRLGIKKVFYAHQHHVNIWSLGQLVEHGCSMKLQGGILTFMIIKGSNETKVCMSLITLFQLKLNLVKSCLSTKEEDEMLWL